MAASKIIYVSVGLFLMVISVAIKLFPLSNEIKLSLGYSNNSVLNFTEIAAINEYNSEEHAVVTEDGYVLTVFRIAEARKCLQKKKLEPVLIMHGLLQNSDVFLDAGPSAGLAYLLSDACFDVWVGNQRGNNYGRKHLTLNADKDAQFWQFSVDEIGFYDLPATIDYILKETGADKVSYVGYSQGSGIFFAMCSERPNYCKKTAVMIALAPGVFFIHNDSVLLRTLFKSAVIFKNIFNLFGIQEIFSKGKFVQEFLEYMCQVSDSIWAEKLCGTFLFLDNYHAGSMASDTQRVIFSHSLVGTSLNNVARYGQVVISEKFQKFDYGEKLNLERYNSTEAPEYNLGLVSAPVVIIQGKSDKLINVQDTKALSKMLPNVLETMIVSDPQWTHFDMIYSQDIKKMIYPTVYEYLRKYS